ncbi:GyrI-like domain-containing protein [Patescibacteria group bacterium]|nr:GyrI-like domain-containing protein [Patescibacteria group bacterium]
MNNAKKLYLKQEYISRINLAINYIEQNITSELNLGNIAAASGFSAFHFHRIFKALVGETLNTFIKRVRAEKASMMLVYNPKYSITRIAYIYGYSSSQTFSRAFKECFNMSPSEFREKAQGKSKICNDKSKNRNDASFDLRYDHNEGRHIITINRGKKINMKVEVKDLPDMDVAYVRHIGPYKGDSKLFEGLINKLTSFAGPRNLFGPDTKFMSLYHDDPKVTEDAKLRLDVCMTVPKDTEVDGEIGKQTLAGGKYAVARFELKDPSEYEAAWNSLYRDWFPESGYQPDIRPPFEMYQNNPKEHPEGLHIVDICIPVKPL